MALTLVPPSFRTHRELLDAHHEESKRLRARLVAHLASAPRHFSAKELAEAVGIKAHAAGRLLRDSPDARYHLRRDRAGLWSHHMWDDFLAAKKPAPAGGARPAAT